MLVSPKPPLGAHVWGEMLTTGEVFSVEELAMRAE
jgi:hypothetical protein